MTRYPMFCRVSRWLSLGVLLGSGLISWADSPPHIVLVMSDDQGWGQTGYHGHPHLKTPHLDAMAAAGIRFNQFYAGASNCSPTRATVLTGRTNNRTGVANHGFPLRRQEKTIAQALRDAGYATGHFGKWHLNGLRGEGVPIFADDPLNPGVFGFDTWVSVTNFFDLNPLMSRNGQFEEFVGDSSEIIVDEALAFMREHRDEPLLVVIWYGTPHRPFAGLPEDLAQFAGLPESEQLQLAELVAMDRSIGTLRAGLRELGIAENTLLWFNGDNGGLADWGPKTVGHLRGFKNQYYEGGIRVPGIVEWPAGIAPGQVSDFPAVTMDIFPTVGELVGLDESVYLEPQDGLSLVSVFNGYDGARAKPIPFHRETGTALIDNEWKLVSDEMDPLRFELYNLAVDPNEQDDLFAQRPEEAHRMLGRWLEFNTSLTASMAGADYPEGRVLPDPPDRAGSAWWTVLPQYQPYLKEWAKRPEYRKRLEPLLRPAEKTP